MKTKPSKKKIAERIETIRGKLAALQEDLGFQSEIQQFDEWLTSVQERLRQ